MTAGRPSWARTQAAVVPECPCSFGGSRFHPKSLDHRAQVTRARLSFFRNAATILPDGFVERCRNSSTTGSCDLSAFAPARILFAECEGGPRAHALVQITCSREERGHARSSRCDRGKRRTTAYTRSFQSAQPRSVAPAPARLRAHNAQLSSSGIAMIVRGSLAAERSAEIVSSDRLLRSAEQKDAQAKSTTKKARLRFDDIAFENFLGGLFLYIQRWPYEMIPR